MWACGASWPLKAKLPGGAVVECVRETAPASFLISVAAPSEPSGWMGSTATVPPA